MVSISVAFESKDRHGVAGEMVLFPTRGRTHPLAQMNAAPLGRMKVRTGRSSPPLPMFNQAGEFRKSMNHANLARCSVLGPATIEPDTHQAGGRTAVRIRIQLIAYIRAALRIELKAPACV
jgi:hypothetical protein